MSSPIVFDNVGSNEVVNQRCILITGRCEASKGEDDHVEVVVLDQKGRAGFPGQTWPMCQGFFKALVILVPGENLVRFTAGSNESYTAQISVQYVPLLQTPPLHLAILIAKDSPLLIDCPPGKFGALSSAHSSLDAAISKFRTTAYMWQALTAEEMRKNGLGRRTFRLEEEWALETLSHTLSREDSMNTTAKIHLIRSDMKVVELRHARLAQQNYSASDRDGLHTIFTNALLAHGAPFSREMRPIVAGLILDAHYDADTKLITAHAALGAYNHTGLSLGIFGSHLTYSWPRFMEEIPDCLLDTKAPGDRVGNDNGECASMWEACSVGQGAFLHEVGHAFSALHTTGIMARGYSKDWPKCFLSKTAASLQMRTAGVSPVTEATPNQCHWDLTDLLRFRNLAHFRLPSDDVLDDEAPCFDLEDGMDDDDDEFTRIVVRCEAGLVKVSLNDTVETKPSIARPLKSVQFTMDELDARFDRKAPLKLEAVALNGKISSVDVWALSNQRSIRIPGTRIRLLKQSVGASNVEADDCYWTVMLKKRSKDGSMARATKIDIRVGCGLDGAIVYYKDGTTEPCGQRHPDVPDHSMGGHQARKLALPKGVDIAKVAVSMNGGYSLQGLRIVLANGKAMGALNKREGLSVKVLEPGPGQRIVGFYGASGSGYGMCNEFGIVTAPSNMELPDSVYDQAVAYSPKGNDPTNESSDTDMSEDNDSGYDNDSDAGSL